MDYLLDTNVCIALINGTPRVVRSHFRRALDRGARMHVSAVIAFELWYGVAKSNRPDLDTRRVETFSAGPVRLLSFEEEDARTSGRIRAALELSGKPIGAYDLLIAGQALRREFTLVTANVKEFRRVKSLLWEDWAA